MARDRMMIDATGDHLTCPSCRQIVDEGRVCGCSSRTYGPKVEALLQRLVSGRTPRLRKKTR